MGPCSVTASTSHLHCDGGVRISHVSTMYEIEAIRIESHSGQVTYRYKAKNSYNQLLTLEVQQYGNEFWVCFFITTKRKKGYQYLKQTGKDGISSLVWAKQCVLDWISSYGKKYEGMKLCVSHDDKRRAKIYKRYLTPVGFKESRDNYKYLFLNL